MSADRTITLGHSPDPDDAFMFFALTKDVVDTEGLRFEHVLQDIQTLNERAARGELDVTALSLFAYASLADRYRLTACGASVGDGYGPLLVGPSALTREELKSKTICVPGVKTTAYLALQLYLPGVKTRVRPFDAILDAVKSGDEEVGLLIHEGQLTWASHGVAKIEDLGEWWKRETGLPLPLGVNGVRRDLGDALERKIQRVLRRSIEWGLEHRAEAIPYAARFGRGIDHAVTGRFVSMYVNDFTLDLGDSGRRGAVELLSRAARAGLVPDRVPLDFVTG